MKIKVGIFTFETDEKRTSLPVLTNDSIKIGNLNCGGLPNILIHKLMIWSDQEKSDITNLISVTPSDIKYISFGEILVSPYQSPLNYYRIIIMQNKKSGKEYIEIQPCYQILPKLKSKSQKSNIKKSVVVKPIKQNCAHKKINAENQLDILLNKIDLMIEELNDWIIYPHKIIKYRRKR